MVNGGTAIAYGIGVLIGCIIFGCITKYINENKGYQGGFAWGFFLTWIGIIVVACKPDNRQYVQQEHKSMYPQAATPVKTWRCASCGAENSDKINYCLRCRADRSEVQAEKIKCPHCGANNNKTNSTCFACGKSLTEKVDSNAPALIKQLADLHAQGILTEEEYNSKKAELLSKL